MDYWLALLGFVAVVVFLNMYYGWLKNNKGISPACVGRLVSMCTSIFLWIFSDATNAPWIFILSSIIIFILIVILNINTFGIGHGMLSTLWQFFSCALVVVFIMMVVNEKNSKVPKQKQTINFK